jgi:hypothetical protein
MWLMRAVVSSEEHLLEERNLVLLPASYEIATSLGRSRASEEKKLGARGSVTRKTGSLV